MKPDGLPPIRLPRAQPPHSPFPNVTAALLLATIIAVIVVARRLAGGF